MYSETYRPSKLSEVFGHFEIKEKLKKYLESDFKGSVFLVGSPGIGKTTLALTSANTFGFDPLEINASNSLRSYEDVDRLRDSCRGSINIHSFLIGDIKRKTCVILDELDGSDPHAQNKIIEWIKDPERKVPIICTGNELPTIIKRNDSLIKILRCFPPSIEDIKEAQQYIDNDIKFHDEVNKIVSAVENEKNRISTSLQPEYIKKIRNSSFNEFCFFITSYNLSFAFL